VFLEKIRFTVMEISLKNDKKEKDTWWEVVVEKTMIFIENGK
jgi:hypothetical protein